MTLSSGTHRRFRITIRLSAAERAIIDAAAEKSRLTLSSHVRRILLAAKPHPSARRPCLDVSLLARILASLGKIGSALEQIAAVGLGDTDRSFIFSVQRELLRTLADLRACRSLLLEALGRRGARR
ncbi:plasmid mobilization protein [Rhodovulum sp. PH10]|uniref:plasmid mobilization protein n=1 Tax=Rhodovulum sp. PH10 TaxID=1187851 RepID=UPI00058B70BC|nr:hypothetical protein [Rhodovulum sp. PH10]